jgi:membrane-associated protease RseP (regulator of RpoE activity)
MDFLISIVSYKYFWTILFYLTILIIVALNWKKFEIQGGFIALYKTRFGLKLMDSWGKRYRELIRFFSLIGVGVAFVVIFLSVILVFFSVYSSFKQPIVYDGSPLVLPGVPLAGLGGLVFPLIIGWITLFIVIVVHEFSHGVVARAYDIPVKSSGLVFLGPILGAFVEPDEEKTEKASDIAQYSVFAAGPVSNFILAIFALLLFIGAGSLVSALSYDDGISVSAQKDFPAFDSGIGENVVIKYVDGVRIYNLTDFFDELYDLKPETVVNLSDGVSSFIITAGSHPSNESRGYLGITMKQNTSPSKEGFVFGALFWIIVKLKSLFGWTALISALVGQFNLNPLFITDGGRMVKIAFEKLILNPKKALRYYVLINKICVFCILLILLLPLLKPIVMSFF